MDAWYHHMIDTLVEQGVDYFCIAPGSRSAPLVLAAAHHTKITTFVHFDERGLAFHALGYGKATRKPAALIVTSGTAVGNLFPAVIEAFHAHIPLILITADRPPELRGKGSNQTIDQVKLFQSYVHYTVDLPCQDSILPSGYLSSTLAHAAYKAMLGPVHINCMIREGHSNYKHTPCPHVEYINPVQKIDEKILENWKEILSAQKNGAILLGAHAAETPCALNAIYDLAEALGWPVYADILSGARSYPTRAPFVHTSAELGTPEAILHFGDRLVSKELAEWIQSSTPKLYLLVAPHTHLHDPLHKVTHRIICDPKTLCTSLMPLSSSTKPMPLSPPNVLEKRFSESYLMHLIQKTIPEHYALFIANSMPIRDAERFFFPHRKIGPIFANRGASGIDGNIATAYGIAQGLQRPVLAILGDQTFLHDLNSLAMHRHLAHPVIFLVYNNQGGAIFCSLSIGKNPLCETFFTAKHPFTFKGAAETFAIPYYTADSLDTFSEALSSLLSMEKTCLLEVATQINSC